MMIYVLFLQDFFNELKLLLKFNGETFTSRIDLIAKKSKSFVLATLKESNEMNYCHGYHRHREDDYFL